MASVVIIRSHGATVAVCGPRAELDTIVDAAAPAGAVRLYADGDHRTDAKVSLTTPWSGEPGEVRRGDQLVVTSADAEELRRIAVSETHLAIAAHAKDAVFIHAGAVAWNGAGIVLPGRSMAGKSTLVRELVDRGATYYSDEYAVIGPDGLLHPYLKPIAQRAGDGHRTSMRLDQIERQANGPVVVRAAARLSYEPSAPWPPPLVEGARAVLPLIDNAVAARLSPDRVLDAVAALVETAAVWSGERPDAAIAADWLIEVVERAAAIAPDPASPPAA